MDSSARGFGKNDARLMTREIDEATDQMIVASDQKRNLESRRGVQGDDLEMVRSANMRLVRENKARPMRESDLRTVHGGDFQAARELGGAALGMIETQNQANRSRADFDVISRGQEEYNNRDILGGGDWNDRDSEGRSDGFMADRSSDWDDSNEGMRKPIFLDAVGNKVSVHEQERISLSNQELKEQVARENGYFKSGEQGESVVGAESPRQIRERVADDLSDLKDEEGGYLTKDQERMRKEAVEKVKENINKTVAKPRNLENAWFAGMTKMLRTAYNRNFGDRN